MDPGSVLFDRHRLERRIGAGGMGEVWLATDLLLDQPVALKRIRVAGIGDEQGELLRKRALREARLAAQLRRHRHVVATLDVYVDDGDVWLVLEYVPSKSLAQILRESGPLDPDRVARIGAQVADALAAVHALGIEHRDVTPGNVLVSEDGTARLTDFGISRLAGDTQLTRTGVLSGTFAYLAPEVARTGNSSPASDVFSLGATLYAAIEGRPPFGVSDNVVQQLNAVSGGIILSPPAAGELAPLLMRLLTLDPATRPDAGTARDLLERYAAPVPAPIRSPATSRLIGPWWRDRRVRVAAGAVVMVAALAVGAAFWLRGGAGQDRAGTPALPPTPALPSTVGPVMLTGDARAADPCALLDLPGLRQFGTPFITFGSAMSSCQAPIATTNGDVYLVVSFHAPVSSLTNLGGRVQQLGDLTIVWQGTRQDDLGGFCRNVLVLADRTQVFIAAFGPEPDRCKIAEVGTVSAVNALAREGIRYTPGRTSAWSLAGNDACAALDPLARSKVVGLDSTVHYRGFASWSCVWGPYSTGSPQVYLEFWLNQPNLPDHAFGDPTTIAGHRAWVRIGTGANNPNGCTASVVHRPAPSATAATELIKVRLDAPGAPGELCARAAELAAAAEARLPAP